jgi:hypothetical protein
MKLLGPDLDFIGAILDFIQIFLGALPARKHHD